jgi:uncharacterized protein YecE (DUF72 family)
MTILVGTASWTDKSLIDPGKFHPPTAKDAESRLRYYASQFPLVEVDSSYYAIPVPTTAQFWSERTPDHFVFNVKAFQLFTGHHTLPQVLPKTFSRRSQCRLIRMSTTAMCRRSSGKNCGGDFLRRLSLRRAGKLGAIHFQFAPWMTSGGATRKHVEHCADVMQGKGLMAVEFRNISWCTDKNRESTLAFERERQLVNVIVDGPQGFASSVPAVWEVTSPELAIVRMHGRNADTWEKKGLKASSDRFNYDYRDDELKEIAGKIKNLSRQVRVVQAVLNNNYQDQGQRNARTLASFLG